MQSTLLVTHRYQSEVPVQRLHTRDELGFEMRWCCWRCWRRLASQRWEGCWWWRWLQFPPPGGKFPRRNRSARGQKCFYPSSASRKALRPKSHLLIYFSRSKDLIYQKMGTKGGPGCPLPTRVCLEGLERPSVLWPPGCPPLVVLISNIYYIFQNNSL